MGQELTHNTHTLKLINKTTWQLLSTINRLDT